MVDLILLRCGEIHKLSDIMEAERLCQHLVIMKRQQ
jgi:hypothetical protein